MIRKGSNSPPTASLQRAPPHSGALSRKTVHWRLLLFRPIHVSFFFRTAIAYIGVCTRFAPPCALEAWASTTLEAVLGVLLPPCVHILIWNQCIFVSLVFQIPAQKVFWVGFLGLNTPHKVFGSLGFFYFRQLKSPTTVSFRVKVSNDRLNQPYRESWQMQAAVLDTDFGIPARQPIQKEPRKRHLFFRTALRYKNINMYYR